MRKSDLKLFKKADIIIFAIIILIAASLFISAFRGGEDLQVLVSVDGKESVFFLDKDSTADFKSRGITLTLTIKDGKAYVSKCDCPDKVCVSSGKIHKNGQIIVCAPAGISIRIVGKGGELDAVAG